MASRPSIAPVRSGADLAAASRLLAAYAAALDVDLAYQNFADELAGLPGDYAPPGGTLLLARTAVGETVGCIALRPLAEAGCCEMKRLYVAPAGRGLGFGRALAEALIGEARRLGYREMRLDTLPTMHAAQRLYRAMGFAEIAPYYDAPISGTRFMALAL